MNNDLSLSLDAWDGHALQKGFLTDEIEKSNNKHDFSTKERKDLSKKNEALPDGSFPIRNGQDLKDAIKSYGLAKDQSKAKSWIIKRAKELNLTSNLPEDWK